MQTRGGDRGVRIRQEHAREAMNAQIANAVDCERAVGLVPTCSAMLSAETPQVDGWGGPEG